MLGIISAIIAGAAMSVQGVFNTRLSEKTGLFESNVIVQALALICSVLVMLFFGNGSLSSFTQVNRLYLTGGIIGAVITVTVMLAVGKLSATYAVSIILIAQLFTAAVIDAFGLFGAEKAPFGLMKYIGLALMSGGIILFKL